MERRPRWASDAYERGDEGLTACAPGWACSELGEACGAEEVYGLYAGAIREGVANCADYLDRIVLRLEGAPSRHYVAEKPKRCAEASRIEYVYLRTHHNLAGPALPRRHRHHRRRPIPPCLNERAKP